MSITLELVRAGWIPGGMAFGGGYAMYNNIVRDVPDRKTSALWWILCGMVIGLFISIPAYFHDRACAN